MTQTWTIDAVVRWASDDFRSRGIESPRLDAEVLLAYALDSDRVKLIVDAQKPLSAEELARFRELVKRRRRHEPVAYLRGFREFYGRSFKVDARVLIPRPDTEVLVQTALDRTQDRSLSLRALDLCTGSGCVAVTLARERPTITALGTDLSADALAVARENAYRLGAYNIAFAQGDLYGALDRMPIWLRRFDLVTANPPYIQTAEIDALSPDIREFEPRLALDGGGDGLSLVRRIVEGAPGVLRKGGVLTMEIGQGEADATKAIFETRGFTGIQVTRDYARIERVVSGIWC